MEIENIKAIQPRFNYIITTADYTDLTQSAQKHALIYTIDGKKFEKEMEANSMLSIGEYGGGLHSFQRVIAVGSFVKDIKVGDIVKINLTKYAQMKYEEGSIKANMQDMNSVISYNVPKIKLNGVEYLKLADNDVDFIVTDYEGKESEESEEDAKSGTDSNESPDKTSD